MTGLELLAHLRAERRRLEVVKAEIVAERTRLEALIATLEARGEIGTWPQPTP